MRLRRRLLLPTLTPTPMLTRIPMRVQRRHRTTQKQQQQQQQQKESQKRNLPQHQQNLLLRQLEQRGPGLDQSEGQKILT